VVSPDGGPVRQPATAQADGAARQAADSWAAAEPARVPESAAPAQPARTPAPAAASAPAGGTDDATAVRRSWDEIVRMVGRSSKKAAAFAREAVVRDIDGNTLVLLFKHKIHANGVENDPAPLMEAVHQVLGGKWQLRCEVGGDPRAASRAAAAAPASAPPRSAPPKAAAPARAPAPAADDWPTPARVGGAAPAAPAQQTGRRAAVVDDGPPLEEPPYDPEYDGPPPRTIEGFDPGDEPTDEIVDAAVARQTTEQAAVDSLRRSFNLEKLD
jgi:DNA polymerase-3 subunit gamma/tau